MALGNPDTGQDITLSTLIRNPALSGYAKGVVSSPNFMNIVASIRMKQDAVTLAQLDICADLNTLPAHEREKLNETFPKTPAAFSSVLAYWLLKLSEMNQANFVGEKIDEPNSFYKKMIQNNQLVVFSTISYNHVFIYRLDNSWDRRLQDTRNGCNLVSKYHYFLTSAVKRFVLIHLSALCRTCDIGQAFLDCQMHPRNFRNRMETAREILLDYLLSEGAPQLVLTELRQFRQHLDQISEFAAAASAASSVAALRAHSPGSSLCCATSSSPLVPVTHAAPSCADGNPAAVLAADRPDRHEPAGSGQVCPYLPTPPRPPPPHSVLVPPHPPSVAAPPRTPRRRRRPRAAHAPGSLAPRLPQGEGGHATTRCCCCARGCGRCRR